MSNAHTPGPWACISGARGGEFTVYLPADGMVICSRNQYEDKHEEFLANARLIAAAPEILEALQECLAVVAELEKKASVWRVIGDKARAAVAKATGERA